MCEGQIHFARMYDGTKSPLPCFQGVRGPEVVRSLLEIEATFEKNLQILKDVKKTILDVKVWIITWVQQQNKKRVSVVLTNLKANRKTVLKKEIFQG